MEKVGRGEGAGEYVTYLISLSFVKVVEESQEGKGQNWRQFSQMTFLYYTAALKLIVLLLNILVVILATITTHKIHYYCKYEILRL